MYFAVATIDTVIIYSTESEKPVGIVGNIHYSCINDLTWYGS
jgi:chromatin assembly factor 1 subunit B